MSQVSSQQTKFLLSFIKQFHLRELVQAQTRVTATSTSQLDLILTTIPCHFQSTTAIPFGASDHHMVLTHFCARGISQSSDHKIAYSRRYSKLNKNMLDDILSGDFWDEIFSIDDVNVCVEAFTLVIQHILDIMIPLKKMRIKRTCSPWSHDADVTIARHYRDWLHRKAFKSGNSEDWMRYRKSCNKVTAMTRSAKQQYLSALASNLSNDSHKFWRNFKHLSARQKSPRCTVDVDGDSMNQHFLTIAHKTIGDLQLSSTCPMSYLSSLEVPHMTMVIVDVGEVYRHICDLNIHKAVGVDKIPTRFIKASPSGMAVLLSLINKSITLHTFPDIWKNAIVVPVQKSKQSSSLSNFRPISILA